MDNTLENYQPAGSVSKPAVVVWRGAGIYIIIFALSGLSGLIYESIWSHYLKLFLGHAAYAQSLVLAIFMGGMAIGSWLVSKYSGRWKNLLVGYALTEGVIGVIALFFHTAFDHVMQAAFTLIIPSLGSVVAIHTFKWSLAAVLILPQSIMLGMTFPLMSAGILRRFRLHSGSTVAVLYFVNSLGGAVGVLLSGFLLLRLIGLPGTIMTAGLINVVLALTVWLLAKNHPAEALPAQREAGQNRGAWLYVLLGGALVTGAASFMYEIAWIRMLSMVLGSSTHAFELMLSAFIFGLAFGGLWIRRRIIHVEDPVRYTGFVQVAMGILALGSLLLYSETFQLMRETLAVLTRTAGGYSAFNLISHGIALVVMLPATFCAGMTLPLMTYALFKKGFGEQSIGSIYAANTVGAILGVILAVHVLITAIGVKGLIVTGAVLDIILGILLVGYASARGKQSVTGWSAVAGLIAILVAVFGIQLDPAQMASGVYRHGKPLLPEDTNMLFYRDGKTASIALYEDLSGNRVISTNGKPDAAIRMTGDEASADEVTMVLAAALPLAYKPDARKIANVGMGSGLTTHALLAFPGLERVDTVEIEPYMVEGARGFRPRVERAFTDPRSRIHIEDARTFFSTHGGKYDIIVSEPSNPWVSGVASLFSEEFYRRITDNLVDGGVFVQWVQIYEIDTPLIASIIKALGPYFEDYSIFSTDSANILIIAKKDGKLGAPGDDIFSVEALNNELRRVNVNGVQDILVRRIGGKEVLDRLIMSYGTPANSDFFPYLDLHAARSRYLGLTASVLNSLGQAPLPIMEMLESRPAPLYAPEVTRDPYFNRSQRYFRAIAMRDAIIEGRLPVDRSSVPQVSLKDSLLTTLLLQTCGTHEYPGLWLDSVFRVATETIPYLAPVELQAIWDSLRSQPCFSSLTPRRQEWVALFEMASRRDGAGMAQIAHRLLMTGQEEAHKERFGYLISAAMLGYLAEGNKTESLAVWNTYAPRLVGGGKPNIFLQMLFLASIDV